MLNPALYLFFFQGSTAPIAPVVVTPSCGGAKPDDYAERVKKWWAEIEAQEDIARDRRDRAGTPSGSDSAHPPRSANTPPCLA